MGRTKMMGCGNTTCRHNNCYDGCQLKEVILGNNGACLYFLPDVEKSKLEIEVELSTYAEAKAQEVKEAQRKNEPEARRIGFRVDD